jgi:hypothetical protein
MPISFTTITSNDGVSLTLNSSHSFFSLPFVKQLKLNEPLPISYQDLYLIVIESDFNGLTQDELLNYLGLVDMLSLPQSKVEILDFLINEFRDSLDPQLYLTPDVLNLRSDYFLRFHHLLDNYIELFSDILLDNDDHKTLKSQKFFQCCKDNKIEDVKLLFE